MSRGLSRVAMACLGFVVFAVYSALALGSAVLVWWVLSDPPGVGALALASVLVVLVGGFVGYRLGTLRLLTSLETAPLSRTHAPGVYRLVARLCRRLNVREPRLLVADLGAPNALSLGGPRRGVVVLDRHLLSPGRLRKSTAPLRRGPASSRFSTSTTDDRRPRRGSRHTRRSTGASNGFSPVPGAKARAAESTVSGPDAAGYNCVTRPPHTRRAHLPTGLQPAVRAVRRASDGGFCESTPYRSA